MINKVSSIQTPQYAQSRKKANFNKCDVSFGVGEVAVFSKELRKVTKNLLEPATEQKFLSEIKGFLGKGLFKRFEKAFSVEKDGKYIVTSISDDGKKFFVTKETPEALENYSFEINSNTSKPIKKLFEKIFSIINDKGKTAQPSSLYHSVKIV